MYTFDRRPFRTVGKVFYALCQLHLLFVSLKPGLHPNPRQFVPLKIAVYGQDL